MRKAEAHGAQATLRIGFRSRNSMHAVAEALKPELTGFTRGRARAQIRTQGRSISLHLEAKDTTALRAIVSSYLRLLTASLRTCDALAAIERSSSAR